MTSFALLTLSVLSFACGQAQQSDALVETDDPELRRIAEELLPDLATRSGLELRAPVRLVRRSRAELVRYLEAKLAEELSAADADAVSESYRLLGLVPEGLDLWALLLAVYSEQVAGFYDPDSTALFVMDDQPAESIRTVLIHELVHAVQDQSVDLDSLTARARGNDRQLAAQAAIEGHATLVMLEYLTEQMQGRPVDLTDITDFAAQVRPALQSMGTQYPALANAPRIVQEALLFPYLEGAGFVHRLWHEAGRRPSPLAERLPQSTEQVMEPGPALPPDRDEPTEVTLQLAGPVRYSNTLGQMATVVLLEELVGSDGAGAARGWDGDRFALFDSAEGPALVWASVWDDASGRDDFIAMLAPALGRFPRAAALEARTFDGRPGALLSVGTRIPVTATLSGRRLP